MHQEKPEILREMTDSKSENSQDETEAPCHTDIKKGLKDNLSNLSNLSKDEGANLKSLSLLKEGN